MLLGSIQGWYPITEPKTIEAYSSYQVQPSVNEGIQIKMSLIVMSNLCFSTTITWASLILGQLVPFCELLLPLESYTRHSLTPMGMALHTYRQKRHAVVPISQEIPAGGVQTSLFCPSSCPLEVRWDPPPLGLSEGAEYLVLLVGLGPERGRTMLKAVIGLNRSHLSPLYTFCYLSYFFVNCNVVLLF